MAAKVFKNYEGDVIKINGKCYYYIGMVKEPVNANPADIEGVYSDCEECALVSSSSESSSSYGYSESSSSSYGYSESSISDSSISESTSSSEGYSSSSTSSEGYSESTQSESSSSSDSSNSVITCPALEFSNTTLDALNPYFQHAYKLEETDPLDPFYDAGCGAPLTLSNWNNYRESIPGINGSGRGGTVIAYGHNGGATTNHVLPVNGANLICSLWYQHLNAPGYYQKGMAGMSDRGMHNIVAETTNPGGDKDEYYISFAGISTGTIVGDSDWHHVCAVIDGSTNAYFYHDGVELGNTTITALTWGTFRLTVGQLSNKTGDYPQGLDEVYWWWNHPDFASAGARDAFVSALYNGGSGRFIP